MSSTQQGYIQVRRASIENAHILVDFNIAMALETEGKELDPDLVRTGVESVLTRSDLGFYLIAELEGRAAGQLLVTYEWSDWRNAFFWWVQSVYVTPDHRRKGVYSALHSYVTLESRRSGNVCGLRLYVDKDNEVAQQVYRSLRMSQARYDMFEIEFENRPDDGRR